MGSVVRWMDQTWSCRSRPLSVRVSAFEDFWLVPLFPSFTHSIMASMAATSAPQRGQYKRPRGQHQGPRRGRGGPSRSQTQRPDRAASTSKARDAAPQTSPGVGADDDVDEQGPSKTMAEAEADVPIFERTSLVLASNPLPPLSSLGATLARFTNLHRLDMSDMQPGQADDDDDDDQEDGSSSRRLHSLSFLRDAQREAEKEFRRARKARRKEGKARQEDDEDEGKTLSQTLTWLNLSSNPTLGEIQEKRSASSSSEDVLAPLSALTSLRVLNLSSCSLLAPPPRSALLPLSESLCALVLSHNRLTTRALAEALPAMPNLNTLVLSHNRLTGLPKALPGLLPRLAKLSVSHNDLGAREDEAADGGMDSDDDDDSDNEDEQAKSSAASNALPDFTMNTSLREVRLSHNPRLRVLPAHIASWGRGTAGGADEVDEAPPAEGSDGAKPRARKHVRGLELLDVGHCGLSWETVQDALVSSTAPASGIKNLTLAGNAEVEDEDDYKGAIRRALPGLVVLDGQRVVERGRKKEAAADGEEKSVDAEATGGDSSAAASAAAAGQERSDKKRKRGSRGGSSGKSAADEEGEDIAADVASDDEAEGSNKGKGKSKKAFSQQSSDSQPEPPKLTAPRSGKRAKRGGKEKKQAKERGEGEAGDKEDEDWLAHTRAKAVAAARNGEEEGDDVDDGPSKRKKAKSESKDEGKAKGKKTKEAKRAEKQKKKDQRDKKDSAPRRAWDEVVASGTADGAAPEQAAVKSAPPTSTAVAGVVEVKKKQAQRHQQQADKPAALRGGSSWLGGASGEGTGLGDGWGTGQSAWD